MSEARNNARKTGPGRPFKKGNPGRPKGARHKTTVAMEALLDGEAEELTRKCIECAKEGDMVAMRLCFERLCPPRKDKPIKAELPKVESAEHIPPALARIIEQAAAGELTPSEAQAFAGLLESQRRAFETTELEQRMAALEAERGAGK